MIMDLVRQWFFQGAKEIYFTRINIEARYDMHLFANWMRKKHEKIIEQFLKKEEYKAEIATVLMFLDLVESSSDLVATNLICKRKSLYINK